MTSSTPLPPAHRAQDHRDIITPDAYRLAPELLGTPLARPWRRGFAMIVDGVMIAILSNAPDVLFALAAALLLFRISGRQVEGSYLRKSARLMFRFWGAVLFFVGVITAWGSIAGWGDGWDGRGWEGSGWDGLNIEVSGGGDDAEGADPAGEDGDTVSMTGRQGILLAANMARFSAADDEEEARERAAAAVPALRRSGMGDDEIRELFTGLAANPDKPWLAAAADSVIAGLEAPDTTRAGSPDSLLVSYAAAVGANDSARAAELRPLVALAVAADTVDHLRATLQETREEQARVERELEAAEEQLEEGPGMLGAIRTFADDIGFGLGWAGLYFTAFLTLWKGATPGKRLLRIRVIRLDGKPIGWWASFERFGGYAAGFATGLLGFVQIYWDRNRQAVHDKISETVVINA